jgi:hypothetical protein
MQLKYLDGLRVSSLPVLGKRRRASRAMPFCVDTSAWLDGWRRYYPRDVFQTLWANIEALVDSGEILASEEVYVEIAKKDDDPARVDSGPQGHACRARGGDSNPDGGGS